MCNADRGPHKIVEAGYWRDPVQVFAGVSWFIVGLFIGGLVL